MSPLTALLFLSLFSHFPHTATPISFEFKKFDRGFYSSGKCSQGVENICVRGDASVDSNYIVQLTRNQIHDTGAYDVGWVYYSEPMKLWDNTTDGVTVANFTTRFSFNITKIFSDSKVFADGMAFFLLPYQFQSSHTWYGGCLGLLNYTNHTCVLGNHSFAAVELDTYQNAWDPPSPHVGININSVQSLENRSLGAPSGQIYGEATVSYLSVSKNLSVSLDHYNGSRVELWHVVDLSTVLPSTVTVGFSGSTGTLAELNQLISWSFHSSALDQKITPAPSPEPPPSSTRNRDRKKSILVGVGVAVVFILTVVCFMIWFFLWRPAGKSNEEEGLILPKGDHVITEMDTVLEKEGGPRRIPFQHVVDATANFDSTRKMGAGGSGTVYRGFLKDLNRDVAVKRVWNEDVQRTRKEYMAEVKAISQLRNRHLVQLLGWCHENGEFVLIYELMSNLSLDKHLFATGAEKILPWTRRYNIAVQVASALLYLHEDWKECIVHRDIKSSNIMLDDDLDAKLGDFGVARLTKHGSGLQTTLLCGTIGYIAPECFQTGRASRESDVYAFGIVVLELATGRKAIEPSPREGEEYLVGWVWTLFETGAIVDAADPRLGMKFDSTQMERMLVVGLWCANPNLHLRPTIRKAMAALNFEDVKIDLPLRMPVATYVNPTASNSFPPASSSNATTSSSSGNPSAYAASVATFESSQGEQTITSFTEIM